MTHPLRQAMTGTTPNNNMQMAPCFERPERTSESQRNYRNQNFTEAERVPNGCFFQQMHRKKKQKNPNNMSKQKQEGSKWGSESGQWPFVGRWHQCSHRNRCHPDGSLLGLQGQGESGVIAQTEVRQQTIRLIFSFFKKRNTSTFKKLI